MKNFLLGLLLISLPGYELLAQNNEVSLTTSDYPPYFSEELPQGGVLTELIRTAFQYSDMTLKVSWFPFSRAIKHAQFTSGYDGIYCLWYTNERAEWAYYSDPIFPNVLGFFKRKGTELPAYWNMKYLKASSKRVGVVRGYLNPAEIEDADLELMRVDSDLLNLKVLLRQRVDLIVIDKMVADALIDSNFNAQKESFIWLDPPIEYKMQYIAIAKNKPFAKEKIAAFNLGLRQIRQNGVYQKIMRKHGFDWLLKEQTNWLHKIN